MEDCTGSTHTVNPLMVQVLVSSPGDEVCFSTPPPSLTAHTPSLPNRPQPLPSLTTHTPSLPNRPQPLPSLTAHNPSLPHRPQPFPPSPTHTLL